MKYQDVKLARFVERPNRFIAHCIIDETGELVVVHVKNTGRGKEVLLPDAKVALQHVPSPKRKTDYDLIAVKKGTVWINIDSLVPNRLAYEGILDGTINLSQLKGNVTLVKREVKFENSKFDLYIETDLGEKAFVEVKGMTLENLGVGAFPDAPTLRGKKHVMELIDSQKRGYQSAILFIVQFEPIKVATLHRKMQPDFYQAIKQAQQDGVQVLAYNCDVMPDEIRLRGAVPFEVDHPFTDPNS